MKLFSFQLIPMLTTLFIWGVVVYLAYRVYRKQQEKAKVWKVAISVFIGLFSFSINLEAVSFAVLPLGVWVLYFFLRGQEGRWERYRRFAWLGFWSNYLFLAAGLTTLPIEQVVYPEDKAETYLSTVENATIISIHPSAKDLELEKERLLEQLPSMEQQKIYSEQWYNDTYVDNDEQKMNERFPYQLVGTSSRWGSGVDTMIFIEENGKGLLISTSKKQVYFQFNESVLKGMDHNV
ncbi:hypothetical protein [Bacillus weihaiensis]|uniref:hypothetical protein n=1 Tax=Bacillus weihaiensis TaxID=1547283 RepID=UPI0023574B22|nr:hypothetical protein [Bacillus weihaiensis]